jgi:hypothetical protein
LKHHDSRAIAGNEVWKALGKRNFRKTHALEAVALTFITLFGVPQGRATRPARSVVISPITNEEF